MLIPKRELLALIESMPERFEIEELQSQLHALSKTKQKQLDAEAGRAEVAGVGQASAGRQVS